MSTSVALGLASLLVQAAIAVLYALLLARLNRSYDRPHLRFWILALWIHAVELIAMGAAFVLVDEFPAHHFARLGLAGVHITAAYWHVALLWFGVRQLRPVRSVPPSAGWMILVVLLGIALVTAYVYRDDPQPNTRHYFMHIGMQELIEGVVYLVVGIGVVRARTWAAGLGRTMVGAAFFMRGLLGLHAFGHILLGATRSAHLSNMSAVDILTLVIMGTGMIIALLDSVRREQLTAVRQQERAELSLEQSRERVETLLGYAGDAVFIVDDLGKVLDANPAACGLTGFGHSEVTGRFLGRLVSGGPAHWSKESTGEGFVISRKGVSTRVDFLTVPHVVPEGHVAVLRVIE